MKAICIVTEDYHVTPEIKSLWKAAKKQNVPLRLIRPDRCSLDISHRRLICEDGHAVVPTKVLGRLGISALISGIPLLEMIRSVGIAVINDGMTHLQGRNKAITASCFVRDLIPHPESWYVTAHALHKMKKNLPYPVVFKPVIGAQGNGLRLLRHVSDVADVIRSASPPFFLQQFVSPIVNEKRLFTIGNRVIGGVCKRPATGEWRGNRSAGATFHRIHVDPWEARVAVAAAKSVGAEVSGVDLITTNDGPIILEVNVCPQFEGFSAATGTDVAGEIINYLRGD